jgi:hypothetical protein
MVSRSIAGIMESDMSEQQNDEMAVLELEQQLEDVKAEVKKAKFKYEQR